MSELGSAITSIGLWPNKDETRNPFHLNNTEVFTTVVKPQWTIAEESLRMGIGSVIGGGGGLGTTAFHGHQKITLSSGQEMLIRITEH